MNILDSKTTMLPDGNYSSVNFYGEVPVEDFISGEELAVSMSLQAGIKQFSEESWLLFKDNGITKYVAKKPYRYNLSWDDLHDKDLVYGGRTIFINGDEYRVRIPKGSSLPISTWIPSNDSLYYDPPESWSSEWNRLLYPTHRDIVPSQKTTIISTDIKGWNFHEKTNSEYLYTDSPDYDIFNTLFTQGYDIRNFTAFYNILPSSSQDLFVDRYKNILDLRWIPYIDQEIIVSEYYGRNTWCQESWSEHPDMRIQRGCKGISYYTVRPKNSRNPSYGWRPILEKI